MSVRTLDPTAAPAPAAPRRHPLARLALPVAALWSLAYLVLGIRWLTGASGNPADRAVDPALVLSVLDLLGPTGGAVVYTAVAATGVVLAATITLRRPRPGRAGRSERLIGAAAVVLGAVLAVVMTDYRILATLGYLPMLPLAALGLLPGGAGAPVLTWADVNLVLHVVAGLAWVAAGISYVGATNRNDPDHRRPSWTAPSAVARWGRVATYVAMLVPLGYATTRYAWALGIPLGVSPDLLDELGPGVLAGAGLATGGVVGAVLTWGLLRPWGHTFPRWVPGLGGRRVPVAVAVGPASLVAAAVTSAGLMFWRFVLSGGTGDVFPGENSDVAAWLPELFWPLWGAALAAATYAYVLRRRAAADHAPGRTNPVS